eukprot:Blabericola_migrator_1__460@NODE_110_length_13983_cov_82_900618_g98_i0_p6_GENE_NODE_110_length_13983_cov_82_900618_g98_i0NODE_110_length_13983_cov_82_900618_g98_i0_p6_ORF_typecomplete_len276_score37_46_NODE_110_length_13983_cov_82_900618_g98_i03691196
MKLARRNEMIARWARDGMTGVPIILMEGKPPIDKDMPEPLPMTMEPPRCSVKDVTAPLAYQVKRRVEAMRTRAMEKELRHINHGASSMPSSPSVMSHSDAGMYDEYRDWWRMDNRQKDELREQAGEVAGEMRFLRKNLQAWGSNLYGPPLDYMGPLDYEPYNLQENLYGQVPGQIADISPLLPPPAKKRPEFAGFRPRRVFGQSRADLFVRDDNTGDDYVKRQLMRKATSQDMTKMLPLSYSFDRMLRELPTGDEPDIVFTNTMDSGGDGGWGDD